jgi:hypothetical protein
VAGLLHQGGGQRRLEGHPVVEGDDGESLGGVEVLTERHRHAHGSELVDETGQRR